MKLLPSTEITSIELIQVKIDFRSRPVSVLARPGDIFIINGDHERKTSLLRCIVGLDKFFSGQILINGQSISDFTFEEFVSLRLNLGYFFPMGGLINNRTLFDNLILPFLHHHANYTSAEKVVVRTLKELDLFKYIKNRPFEMPGIARKLSCIARLMAMDTQVLLIEDLFQGLDQHIRLVLSTWIDIQTQKGGIVLIGTFDADVAGLKPSGQVLLASEEKELVA